MKFVICGTLVPTKFETKITDLSIAGNRFLMNFAATLAKYEEVTCLSYIGIHVDPEVCREIQEETDMEFPISYCYGSKYKFSVLGGYLREIKKQLQEADVIITYNAVYAWMLAPVFARNRHKKSVLLLADYSPKESFQKFRRRVYAGAQLHFIRKYDYVVGLSSKTERYLNYNQKFLCIEGGITSEQFNYYNHYEASEKGHVTLMYSGVLENVTGIDLLIQAFHQIQNPDVRLLVSGKGTLADWVKEEVKKDSRIAYLGVMPYDDYRDTLQQADILVNPRNMNLPENSNNFPSKILEYLATGNYIISTKFPGWEKYNGHMEFCDSTTEQIKSAIEQGIIDVREQGEKEYLQRRRFAENFQWDKQMEFFIKTICNP